MQYIQTGRSSVEGWVAEGDAWLFGLWNDLHRPAKVNGDILEIGVDLGASAIELGYCLGSEERLIVCDLFDDPAPTEENAREFDRFYTRQLRRTAAESLSYARQAFENNYLRFHPVLPTIL